MNYLQHFKRVFDVLKRFNVTLNITKCHFVFLFIQTFKHHVSWLRLSTVQEKTKTIKELFFSCIFHQLKNALEFFEYYQKFVSQYTNIAQSLVNLKTKEFKNASLKEKDHDWHINNILLQKLCVNKKTQTKCKSVFEKLKLQLCTVSILIFFNFN